MQRSKNLRPKSPRLLDREIAAALSRSPRAHATRAQRTPRVHAAIKEPSKSSDKRNIDQLAQMFDLPPYDDVDELNRDHIMEAGHYAYKSAIEEDESEDEAEAAREKAEMRAQDEIFGNWYDAVERAASQLFDEHDLELQPTGKQGTKERRYEFKIVPKTSWLKSAEKIRQTADGVGFAYVGNDVKEFLSLGPWSPRQAVLEHLGVIRSYPEVYGSSSARHIYDHAFR